MPRRIWFKEGVFANFASGCKSDDSTDAKIRLELETLIEQPERGLRIPFSKPLFYQLPIELFVAHYLFNEREVEILYLGIPGKC